MTDKPKGSIAALLRRSMSSLKTRLKPGERQIRMNELSNDANYNELKAELGALRAQVEDLNAKLKSTGPAAPPRADGCA